MTYSQFILLNDPLFILILREIMVYRKLRKYFYSLATLVTLMVPQESMAKISPKAFKGITKYFNDGQEYYSPVLGEAALESGLIYNLRFYRNFDPKYEKNNSKRYSCF